MEQPKDDLPFFDPVSADGTRVSPFNMPRPSRPVRMKVLTDPRWPKAKLPFYLRATDAADSHLVVEVAKRKIAQYINGKDGKGKDKEDFPPVGGLPVTLTETFCFTVAGIAVMQVKGNPNLAPYTFNELVALSLTMPSLWEDLIAFAEEVNSEADEDLKNDSTVDGELKLDFLLGTSEATQRSSTVTTPSSAPLTPEEAQVLDTLRSSPNSSDAFSKNLEIPVSEMRRLCEEQGIPYPEEEEEYVT